MIQPINKNQFLLMQKARLATKDDLDVAHDLYDTLDAHKDHCVGMAANMIAKPIAIIAFFDEKRNIVVMLNPVITKKTSPYKTQEGCLSLDGMKDVVRYKKVTVSYVDLNFKKHTKTYTDFVAQTIQHEVDHLSGILI